MNRVTGGRMEAELTTEEEVWRGHVRADSVICMASNGTVVSQAGLFLGLAQDTR